ncbi:MAG: hypothetical protein R3F61_06525 [Myxococcota bacterium]
MTASPEELSVHEEEGLVVCTLRPGRSRTADEAVGFFLLPVLVASTLVAIAYVVTYLSIAMSGTDPAIALVGWQTAFFWLAGLIWLASSAAMWRSAPGIARHAELKLDGDSITLVENGGVGFYALLRDLRGASVLSDKAQIVQVTRHEGDPLVIPMGGNSETAARWVADLVRGRIP